ncbi:unnamed protein product [Dracunculus medinensis]|uniref:Uncharacterized protein n=1 Tax=Dracunculus medinensis TaxID=318479 RepID=A0A0N4UAW9_DRAME|nr:unnamed protein product [Dracunculus medinensis]
MIYQCLPGGAVGDDPITRINLLCSRGIISWRNPVGAVHVQLKSDQTKSGRNCMKLLAKYPSSTKIHIAENQTLIPLLFGSNYIKCVQNTEIISILIQSSIDVWKTSKVVELTYETVKKPTTKAYKCDQCSKEMIVQTFCTSDFILRNLVPTNGCIVVSKKEEEKKIFIAQIHFGIVNLLCALSVKQYPRSYSKSQNICLEVFQMKDGKSKVDSSENMNGPMNGPVGGGKMNTLIIDENMNGPVDGGNMNGPVDGGNMNGPIKGENIFS